MVKNLQTFTQTYKNDSTVIIHSFQQIINMAAPNERSFRTARFTSISFEISKSKNSLNLLDFESLKHISNVYHVFNTGINKTLERMFDFLSKPDTKLLVNVENIITIFYSFTSELLSQEKYLLNVTKSKLEYLDKRFPNIN